MISLFVTETGEHPNPVMAGRALCDTPVGKRWSR